MKVCPECGHIDRSMWRQNRWRTNVEFIHDEYPEDIPERVLEDYKKGKRFSITDDHAYELTKHNGAKNGIITRILIEEWEAFGHSAFHMPRETVDHSGIEFPRLSDFLETEKEDVLVPPRGGKE